MKYSIVLLIVILFGCKEKDRSHDYYIVGAMPEDFKYTGYDSIQVNEFLGKPSFHFCYPNDDQIMPIQGVVKIYTVRGYDSINKRIINQINVDYSGKIQVRTGKGLTAAGWSYQKKKDDIDTFVVSRTFEIK